MKVKRKRDEELTCVEINMITTTKEELRIQKLLEKQIMNFVMEISKNEEFKEVLVNPKYLQ